LPPASKKAKTLLIVLVDADKDSVDDRRRQMVARVQAAELAEFRDNDPVVLLIPKRHIETWLRALLGESVSEEDDCKAWQAPDRETYRLAAQTLYEWSRPNAVAGPTCVDSLQRALSSWNKVVEQ
jgi:hypothetical protein